MKTLAMGVSGLAISTGLATNEYDGKLDDVLEDWEFDQLKKTKDETEKKKVNAMFKVAPAKKGSHKLLEGAQGVEKVRVILTIFRRGCFLLCRSFFLLWDSFTLPLVLQLLIISLYFMYRV